MATVTDAPTLPKVTARLAAVLHTDRPLQTLGRFAAVGLMGTALDWALFAGLAHGLGLPALLANTLSYSAGILNNYTWHRRWTYGNQPRRPVGAQAAQFIAVSLSALLLNDALVLLLTPVFTQFVGAVPGSLLAKAGATAVGLVWNFVANHFWTFRGSSPQGER